MARQGLLQFDERFMPRYAGALIYDPAVALVELVANAWDAYATRVDVDWPDRQVGKPFCIRDNGRGMKAQEFEKRWSTFDYNRAEHEGRFSYPPAELGHLSPRHVYGRNGKGRHGAFCFSRKYSVRTWRDSTEVTYVVSFGTENKPFDWRLVEKKDGAVDHGTEIRAGTADGTNLTEERAREVLGMRFLTDPNFAVFINGKPVTFDDISDELTRDTEVTIDGLGVAKVKMIDVVKADRTTRQHGIAWRVNNRLVGECRWRGSDYQRILDGRSTEAKRFTFIVFADFLADADAINDDWSDFRRGESGLAEDGTRRAGPHQAADRRARRGPSAGDQTRNPRTARRDRSRPPSGQS